MKKLLYVKYDLTGYLGYGNPLYHGLHVTIKRRAKAAERQQRKQHATDQLFKAGGVTELIVPLDDRAKGLYWACDVQRTSDRHYFTTLSSIPSELQEYLVRPTQS